MKLTLAVIAGNAERYIGRFLDHFQPIADEVIVVRATGWQVESDKTSSIAKSRGCITGEYWNDPKNQWPHVDDFSAARNMAFDMATGDFVMWADMDDVISPESIAAIRDAIDRMPDDCDGLEVAYEVPEDGVTVFRERVIRRGSAKWVSPIHEHLVFREGAKLARITNAKILHAPEGSRRTNDERNLRILESIPKDKRTNSHRFHLFQSLRAVGRLDEAAAEVVDLLANPPEGMGKAERFELFIAAGQMASDISTRSNLILQALGTDPARREAYGEMALCMIGMGRPAEALGFTTAMRALSKPLECDWNARGKYYGWLGENLHGMALRANGRIEEADATEQNHFIRHGAKISLLHATRGRVKQAAECRRKWLESAADPDSVEHIFGLDIDDPEVMLLTVYNHVFLTGDGGPVAAWNVAATRAKGEILVQLSDDWEPFQGWDMAIREAIGDTSKPAVLAVSDGHRKDDLLCMAIMTRQRFVDQGYFFYTEFFSMFSDNWFSYEAFRDGVVIDARDRIVFEHIHPAFGKAESDATYERSNASIHYQMGQEIFEKLVNGVSATGVFRSDLHDTHADSPQLADWLKRNLSKDVMVYDLGCGNGFLVDELNAAGFMAFGYEGDPMKPDHIKHDLTTPLVVNPRQVVCIEVGEHVPPEHEATLIANIANATDTGALCVLSWALPKQPGRGHVNCLSNEVVIEKMAAVGLALELDLTRDLRASVDEPCWLKSTIMVFRKI
jgi:hypothetical protein